MSESGERVARRADGGWRARLRELTTAPRRTELLLFLTLWLAYGAAVNSDNLLQFNLQHIGVEAIAERGQFHLDGSSSPHLQPLGDVFLFDGRKYAAKQPGQFMAGALAYLPLRLAGLRYADDYLLTAALVTFLTTSLALAASAVALLRLARRLAPAGASDFWPLLAALSYALATTALAYSGIAHHDALATAYLVVALCLILAPPRETRRADALASAAAGLLVGLAVTTSMLVFFMALFSAALFLWLYRGYADRALAAPFLAGACAGLLPLLVYDAVSFGNPLLLPNLAGDFADTYFRLGARNFGEKVSFYAVMLAGYAPVFLLGLFGLSYFPRGVRRGPAFFAAVALPCVLALYVFNIDTEGDCQYGPRYLLPAMPFACLGLVGFAHLSARSERRLAAALSLAVASASFAVNLLGALRGAMCCPDGRGAFSGHLASLARGEARAYPLALWLALPLAACAALFVMDLISRRRLAHGTESSSD